MEPAFTIGILGGCGNGLRTAQYFGQLAAYYLQTMSRIRMLIPLASKGEQSVASYLLDLKRSNLGLEIAVVLTARQWQEYQQNISHGKAVEYNRIIDAADRREVMGQCVERFWPPELFRLFVERCDLLVFHEHRAGELLTGQLREQITDMAVPLPVQYGLASPGWANLRYPADRKHYRIYGSRYYDPDQEIRQSIAYLRRNNFVIRAEHLPMIFVRKWLAVPPPGWYHYLITPDDTDAIFCLRETPRHDYLSLKVFAYAYAVKHNMWAAGQETPSGADAIRRFRQFGQLLESIAARREAGERVESFDLLDFDGYDKLLKQYGWVQRPDEMNTRLCDE